MDSIHTIKRSAITPTPVLLFDCVRRDGVSEHWSTHAVHVEGRTYTGAVLRHSGFEMQAGAEDGVDGPARLSLSLANTDGHFAQVERACGWKSARMTVRFLFYDLEHDQPASDAVVLFRGIGNAPDEITQTEARLSFNNRLGLQRLGLPQLRIQKRCPWVFPEMAEERAQAAGDDRYSRFHACGYSADQTGGRGNLNGTVPFTSCNYTRADCAARGMLDKDAQGRVTRRFGALEFVPASTLVRSYGEKGRHIAAVQANDSKYNDPVPLVYGTNWYRPPVIVARNDGNLTHIEVLLGSGVMHEVVKVLVERVEIPRAVPGADMTGTGWWDIVTHGERDGRFNPAFRTEACDPYGSLAVMSVVVPTRLSDGTALPRIDVLARGMRLSVYDTNGESAGEEFTNSPAWVLLDVLRRSGWPTAEIDLPSFARVANHCAEPVATHDLHGAAVTVPRYQCNLVLQGRRSAAEIVRGIRRAAGILLRYNDAGQLEAVAESSIDRQQPARPPCSNAAEPLSGGWPAYEFGDGSNGFGDIARRADGETSLRLRSRSTSETPNRYSLEFQDEFNLYQQDGLSVVDSRDAAEAGQEIEATLSAYGVANFSQAGRVLRLQLDKAVRGNLYAEFETGPRAIGVRPGDIVTVTSLRDGLERQPFRLLRVAPTTNFGTSVLTCQMHDDLWYADEATGGSGTAGDYAQSRIPRPLLGTAIDPEDGTRFEIEERVQANTDGSQAISVAVHFAEPSRPTAGALRPPVLSLEPEIDASGGDLASGRDWYYAVSACDARGVEGALSFVVHARVPDGPSTAAVTLRDLSFPDGTAAMNVYRGGTPARLMRIAANVSPELQWTDTGVAASAAAPPDGAFHHANFYWRTEVLPESAVTSATPSSISCASLALNENVLRGCVVRVLGGPAHGQERSVLANTATTVTVSPDWTVVPAPGSRFSVAEASWQFGTAALASPAVFQVPNRRGTAVQITGVAANGLDRESAMELAPVTRWEIGGAGDEDVDVAGQPSFALSTPGRGVLEVSGAAFDSLENTSSITAGTLTVHFVEETAREIVSASEALAEDGTELVLAAPIEAVEGDLVIWDTEILALLETSDGGRTWLVERGCLKTRAAAHSAGEIDRVRRRSFVLPFGRNFFGSPASGAWMQGLRLPNARVVAAELYVTNRAGNSETGSANYLANLDRGLRTLCGGQMALQVPGNLAIHSDAVPRTTIDTSRSIRDVQARVSHASDVHDVVVRVTRNGQAWCELTIAAGETESDPIPGRGLTALCEGDQIGLDVVSVGQSGTGSPGRDLAVTVRF